MSARVRSRPSKLSTLRTAVRAVFPAGLPRRVEAFYAKQDGLSVTLGKEKATLSGLEALLGGLEKRAFRKHRQVTRRELDALDWAALPFYEVFFDESDEAEGARGLAALNLRMRLKLLVSVAGESTDLAIDLSGKQERLYYVHRMHEAYPLVGLDFDGFVEWFTRFGTRRWYFAFLDKQSEAALNIDLRAGLERSLADFPAADWAPLLERLPKKRTIAKRAATVSRATTPVPSGTLPAWGQPPLVTAGRPRSLAFAGADAVGVDGDYALSVVPAGAKKARWSSKHVKAAAISPDGLEVATLELDRDQKVAALVVRALATGKPRGTAKLEADDVAWGPGGLLVLGTDGTARTLDAKTLAATTPVRLPENARSVTALAEGVLLFTQKQDPGSMQLVGPASVQLVDAGSGAVLETWAGGRHFATAPGFLAVGLGTSVTVFDRASRKKLCTVKAPGKDTFGAMAFSADGSALFCEHRFEDDFGRSPSFLMRLDAKSGAFQSSWPLGQRPGNDSFGVVVDTLAISPTGVLAVSASVDPFAAQPLGVLWWQL